MPDISIAVHYSTEIMQKIAIKKNDANFKYTDWADDDLLEVRKFIRDYYKNHQGGVCCYCRNPVSLHSAANCHIEHIVPKSLYLDFVFTEKNLCVICADCNTIKKDQETRNQSPDTIRNGGTRVRYPYASSAFKIVHPHIDEYDDHIQEFDGFYVDKTEKGHFTIGACTLNRKIRKYGWEKEITDSIDVNELMTKFLASSNPLEQFQLLKKFKKVLVKL